jgi:environmental stress-induced protein Ves
MARVETDGPFSVFPGVTRTIMVLDGDEMELEVAGTRVRLGPEPFTFDGEAPTSGTLRGSAVTDFNVMVRRGEFSSSTERIAAGRSSFRTRFHAAQPPSTVILVAPASGARLEFEALGFDLELAAHDAVMVDGVTAPLHGTVTSAGSSVLVVLTPGD